METVFIEYRASDDTRDTAAAAEKHVPAVYLTASEQDRREILAGLLDTDAPARLSLLSDRHQNPAGGILGGLPGGPSVIAFGDGTKPHPKSRTSIGPRESVLLLYAGGGGYGDPKKRAREAVLEDLRHGYISAAAAKTIYGVE